MYGMSLGYVCRVELSQDYDFCDEQLHETVNLQNHEQ